MNKIYRLILILPLVILGCTSNRVDEIKVLKKIDSLDMNIFSENGDKIYSIYSPHTTYDNNIRKFKLKKTTINIFEGKKAKYVINSNESSLMNNNKLLELKGNVKLKTIDKEEDTLQADYFYWDIKETDYLLKGNIIFENKNIILLSDKAKMGSDNIIEFFNPVKYIIKDNNNEKVSETNSENAFYNMDTETVSFGGRSKRVRSIIYF